MTRRALGAALCLLLGCGGRGDAPKAGSSRLRGVFPTNATQPEQAAQPVAPTPAQPTPSAQPLAKPVATAEAPAAAEKPKRDYAAELLTAVGSPTDCLKTREGPDVPSEILVELEGHFLETGAMSRGYARSSVLDPGELDCMRGHLESVRLQPPIEAAPRTVSATLKLTLKTTEKSTE
ncbi:MAG: hypothetical protein ACHQ53_01475 [Polyangiales bacterium]